MTAAELPHGRPPLRPAQHVLLQEEDPALRRWIGAGVVVVLLHAGLLLWVLYSRDQSPGIEPAAIMIELAPLDVAPMSESQPDVTPGPQMTEAQPEEMVQPETIPVPELPSAPKPTVVLMPPHKLKPRKTVKVIPKPVKPVHQPPAPHTSAPPRGATQAARAASSRAMGLAAAGAARNACAAELASLGLNYPEAARAQGVQGTVRLAIFVGRNGSVESARVVGSSGSSILDQAALQRARGKKCPPMETSVNYTLPVRFHLN